MSLNQQQLCNPEASKDRQSLRGYRLDYQLQSVV